jgi:uncharacterized protein (DUF4415 family)
MKEKSSNTKKTWVDPDDAPELTEEFFEKGIWRIGDKVVSRQEAQAEIKSRMGRPPVESPKQAINIRLGADILSAFKATGKGWQTRIDSALRDWLKEHKPA